MSETEAASPEVGDWIRRVSSPSKWHYVVRRSRDGELLITECGTAMRPVTLADRFGLEVSKVMPLTRLIGQPQLCKRGCRGA